MPWPPHDGWHAHASFKRRALPFPQQSRRSAVGFERKPRPVVGSEDDQRVFGQVVFLERFENQADAVIDFADNVAVNATRAGFQK